MGRTRVFCGALLLGYCMLMVAAAGESPPETVQVDNDSFLAGFNGPFPTVTGYAGTEISSTVSLLYQTDWDVNYVGRAADDWNSTCIDMLYRASESKAKVVNFMVTHYWVDDNFDGKVGKKRSAAMCWGVCWPPGLSCSCAGPRLSQPQEHGPHNVHQDAAVWAWQLSNLLLSMGMPAHACHATAHPLSVHP
jgi:hypothetical protein